MHKSRPQRSLSCVNEEIHVGKARRFGRRSQRRDRLAIDVGLPAAEIADEVLLIDDGKLRRAAELMCPARGIGYALTDSKRMSISDDAG
jgi:hypothetical protein